MFDFDFGFAWKLIWHLTIMGAALATLSAFAGLAWGWKVSRKYGLPRHKKGVQRPSVSPKPPERPNGKGSVKDVERGP